MEVERKAVERAGNRGAAQRTQKSPLPRGRGEPQPREPRGTELGGGTGDGGNSGMSKEQENLKASVSRPP